MASPINTWALFSCSFAFLALGLVLDDGLVALLLLDLTLLFLIQISRIRDGLGPDIRSFSAGYPT